MIASASEKSGFSESFFIIAFISIVLFLLFMIFMIGVVVVLIYFYFIVPNRSRQLTEFERFNPTTVHVPFRNKVWFVPVYNNCV
jgi:hypothetical protein